MNTDIDEIADGVYRISTYAEPADLVFNQFLIMAEQPLLWHCGHRRMFRDIAHTVARVMPPERLRWLSFGHVEADEMGAMNSWLGAAPAAQVVQGSTGVLVSVADLADREPRALRDGEVLDLGGRRVRWIDTPHVPHGWDAGLIYEEVTGTLFAGDLFTAYGHVAAKTESDIVGPAIDAEDASHASAVTPSTASTVRNLAAWKPRTLALMHGPSFTGDAAGALGGLADDYERRLTAQVTSSE
ncbi:MAG: hypothetical protein LBV34_12125 [Nocardiopsaceae bacterium]|nr:hypothetical protein [Nocardiopsaceae bacterium]